MSTASVASARTGEEYFNSGVRTARRVASFGGLEQLYDHHYAAFGYTADQLKHATIGGLRGRVSWQSSLDALMRAVEIDPQQIEWQRWTALVLEELSRFDDALLVRRTIASIEPDSLENNCALGRLLECKGEPVHEYYAQALTDSSDCLLALARAAALSGPIVSEHITQLRLKDHIQGALILSPGNVALHLARGFIGIAEHDDTTTRRSFLTALVLAEQPESKKECDPWSLVFAQAFLLDHSDMTTSGLILPSNPIRLALARAAALRSHGAIMPALREYGATASQLLVQKQPRAYRIYNGYKIVFFKNDFYGVPKDVRDFSILRGCVVGIPDVDGGPGVRSLFAAMLRDGQRARLRYLLRIARPYVQFTEQASLVAIRALRDALGVAIRALRDALRVAIRAPWLTTRILWRLAGDIYLRKHIVGGVLIDSDADRLQQRIDTLKQASPDATASARPSAPDRSDREIDLTPVAAQRGPIHRDDSNRACSGQRPTK